MYPLVPEFTAVTPMVIADAVAETAAQVPSPRQYVALLAFVPLFKLLTERLPVTPVESGRPVALVKTPCVGVPSEPLYVTKPPLAFVALPKAEMTPVPAPDKPVETGRPVTFDMTPETGVPSAGDTKVGKLDRTTEPEPVLVVVPVPPLATASVPPSVIAPLVAVFGVNPVVPPLNVVTLGGVVQANAEPFH